ncbi:MAG: hypothetical protein ABUJ92_00735 [Desulfobacterales bacterium]
MNDIEAAYAMMATAPTHLTIDGQEKLLSMDQRTEWLSAWGEARMIELMGEREARDLADKIIIEARY